MKIEINGQTINIPDGDKSISILEGLNLGNKSETLNMNNIIATADLGTIAYMKDVFKRNMGSIVHSEEMLKLLELSLRERAKSAVVVNKEIVEKEQDMNDFSKPEIHSFDGDFSNVSSIEVDASEIGNEPMYFGEIKENDITYSSDNKYVDDGQVTVDFNTVSDVMPEQSTVEYFQQPIDYNVTGDYSAGVSTIINESELANNFFAVDSNVESKEVSEAQQYRSDPSQSIPIDKKETTLEKLQRISSEGPIFLDEQRIEDKNLTIYNSISLGKIEVKPLLNVNPEKTNQINTSKDSLLEMGMKKLDTLRKVCKNIGKFAKDMGIKIKNGVKCKYNEIQKINFDMSVIGETSKKFAYKIKEGSKNLAVKGIDSVLSNNEKIKENLNMLREKLISQQIDTPTYEEESVKVM